MTVKANANPSRSDFVRCQSLMGDGGVACGTAAHVQGPANDGAFSPILKAPAA